MSQGIAAVENGPRRVLASPELQFVLCVVSAVFAGLAARDGMVDLYRRWAFEEEYGYGFLAAALVPLIAWRRRHELAAAAGGAQWPGLAIVVVAQITGLLGILAESYYIEQISFIATLLGLSVALLGIGVLSTIAPLAVLLLLTVPFPYTLQAMLTVKLQVLSTDIGVAIVRIFGIPVFVEGNIIDLGTSKLHVAEACSGLRYLLPLTCISFIFAYLYRAPLWKKAVLVVSAPIITVAINGLRIAAVAWLVDRYGLHMAEGFMHQLEGWVIFLLGALILAFEVALMERLRLSGIEIDSLFERASDEKVTSLRRRMPSRAVALSLLACLTTLTTSSWLDFASDTAPKRSREQLGRFPLQIADWNGREVVIEPDTLKVLKSTDQFMADFSRGSAKTPVNVFVSYYDTLSKSGAIHSPRVCLPGTGWEIYSIEQKDYALLVPGGKGTFNRMIIQKSEQKMLMYYWIHQRERRTASEFMAKYYLLVDSLFEHRKDGGLVRLFTPVSGPGQNYLEEAELRLLQFVRSAVPAIDDFYR